MREYSRPVCGFRVSEFVTFLWGSACLGFDPVCTWRTYCREEAEEDDEELRVDHSGQQRRLVTDVGRALDALAAVQPHVPVHG